ncbi:MAG: hypothetical protein U0L53_00455, partial [Bacteroidales bacterium]|nr:hypothetical protein [Bacteroidales bacterium]
WKTICPFLQNTNRHSTILISDLSLEQWALGFEHRPLIVVRCLSAKTKRAFANAKACRTLVCFTLAFSRWLLAVFNFRFRFRNLKKSLFQK